MWLLKSASPLMCKSRMDYTDGEYLPEVESGDGRDSRVVSHTVSGENLVQLMLESGDAIFAAEISSPHTVYRKLEPNSLCKTTDCKQIVSWDAHSVLQPVYIRPLVLATRKKRIKLSSSKHGVHAILDGCRVQFQPGTILAKGQIWVTQSQLKGILRLVRDGEGELKEGSYRIEESTSEGFHFRMIAHPDLYDFLRHPGEQHKLWNAIIVGALAIGFDILRRDFDPKGNEEGRSWVEYLALNELHKMMEEQGIPAWDEDGFSAEVAATRLMPILFKEDDHV